MYTWSKKLRILNYALYTRVTENVILLSRAWRRGMAVSGLPANQTCTCVVYVSLCMCSARYYRWKWLEGHTSSAPQNTILRSSHSYTDFVAWFEIIVTGLFINTCCTVIWDAHFKLDVGRNDDLAYTWWRLLLLEILSRDAHLEAKFKIRTLPTCDWTV